MHPIHEELLFGITGEALEREYGDGFYGIRAFELLYPLRGCPWEIRVGYGVSGYGIRNIFERNSSEVLKPDITLIINGFIYFV